jgi:hypothetical protein
LERFAVTAVVKSFRYLAIATLSILAAVGAAVTGCQREVPSNSDSRELEGSRKGQTLEGALADFALQVPPCSLEAARFWDAPEDWDRNLYLKSDISASCRQELIAALHLKSLQEVHSLPHWAMPSSSTGEVKVESGSVILPPVSGRRKDMQVYIAFEDGTTITMHLNAVLP